MSYLYPRKSLLANWQKRLSLSLISLACIGIRSTTVAAQVVENQTLPADGSTQVTFTDGVYEITEGTTRGTNSNLLFHSFDSFSLEAGQIASFNHEASIETIVSRVTGGLASQIDGTIRAGDADLFLINPQGITFGPSAKLEVGGSFIASTADQVTFAGDVEFSVENPQSVSLLTVSQPIGLTLGESSSSIINRGDLSVSSGETVALISNGINLIGDDINVGSVGVLFAPSGRIELASIAPGSSVNLTHPEDSTDSTWTINYDTIGNNQSFRDIQLSRQAVIANADPSDRNSPSGSIRLQGRQIFVDGSLIIADNFGLDKGGELNIAASEQLTLSGSRITAAAVNEGDGGDLTVDAPQGKVELLGGSLLATEVNPFGNPLDQNNVITTGDAGMLTIDASGLTLQDGSVISTSTFSEGAGGVLNINVPDGTVELLGGSLLETQSAFGAIGPAGALNINAANFRVREGSKIFTSSTGDGPGGDLFINTPGGVVEISGGAADNSTVSSLSSTTLGADENAGNIQINTRTLLVQDGGRIEASTLGLGDGGKILINATESVTVSEQMGQFPSQIFASATTVSQGNAGSIEIITGNLVVQDGGIIFTSTAGPGDGGNLVVEADEVTLSGQGTTNRSGLFARTRSNNGRSGRLNLTADTLRIEEGARFTISSINDLTSSDGPASDDSIVEGEGLVRDAVVNARTVFLNNGQITAETLSSDGGDIYLNVEDLLLLRNNSLISTTAGTSESDGTGGDININIPNGFIIAAPDENNDIIARAFSDTGGNININTQNIIGFDTRQADISDTSNDINASSELGEDGTITLNNLELDPTQGLLELPTNLSSPNQVAQRCLADSQSSNAFIITGQGGTTPTPRNIIQNETDGLLDLGNEASIANNNTTSIHAESPPTSPFSNEQPQETLLVEAQAWQRSHDGTITLTAQAPNIQIANSAVYPACSQQARR